MRIFSIVLFVLLSGCSIERALNKVDFPVVHDHGRISIGDAPISASAVSLHNSLWVADLHSDSLLWNRDLTEHGSFGHVDGPRSILGGIDLLVASTVSKTPWGLNMEANDDTTDMLIANSMLQGWPARTWSSPFERVLFQLEKMHGFEKKAPEQFQVVRTKSEFAQQVSGGRGKVGILLATEGAHALEGKMENLDVLFDAGLRSMGLVHFFDNKVGGSAHGMAKGGLTLFGAKLIAKMEEKGVAVDLAHASAQLIDEALKVTTKPVFVSHTGVRGTCDNQRNLTDEHVKKIAATGGLIGIGFFEPAVCTRSYSEIAKALRYVVDLVGVKHAALGSDFDGAVPTPTDIAGMAALTEALLQEGLNEEDIRLIMGGNIQRYFMQVLPD